MSDRFANGLVLSSAGTHAPAGSCAQIRGWRFDAQGKSPRRRGGGNVKPLNDTARPALLRYCITASLTMVEVMFLYSRSSAISAFVIRFTLAWLLALLLRGFLSCGFSSTSFASGSAASASGSANTLRFKNLHSLFRHLQALFLVLPKTSSSESSLSESFLSGAGFFDGSRVFPKRFSESEAGNHPPSYDSFNFRR